MIVTCNTSPITNLAAIGQFRLFSDLFQKIYIAEGVWNELNAYDKHWPGRNEVAASDCFEIKKVKNQALVISLQSDLDQGEAETIALALEMKTTLVIMDERDGRHAAERLGLHAIGVIGILIQAKARGKITELRPHMDALRNIAGFYIGNQLYSHALKAAGEAT